MEEQDMNEQLKTSSGVEKLIDRLRSDGVQAGEKEAQRIIAEAEKKAGQILSSAQAQADDLLARARSEMEKERNGTKESLRLAFRDAILQLKESLTSHFRDQVKKLVEKDLSDRDFLKEVIIALAGRAAPVKDEQIEILLSREWFGTESEVPSAVDREQVDPFIIGVSRDMLRSGVEFRPSTRKEAGLRVHLKDTDMEIDMTEEALSDLILGHLTPRFRQIIEGTRH
jgi:V/A-type H+/Na+-transporting ATPase subunit E